jgi:hypothetical protein
LLSFSGPSQYSSKIGEVSCLGDESTTPALGAGHYTLRTGARDEEGGSRRGDRLFGSYPSRRRQYCTRLGRSGSGLTRAEPLDRGEPLSPLLHLPRGWHTRQVRR